MSFSISRPDSPDVFKPIRFWSGSGSVESEKNIYLYNRDQPFMLQDSMPGRVRKIRYTFDKAWHYEDGSTKDHIAIRELRTFIVQEGDLFKDYMVDFNDSILDTAGWKNARHFGSKLQAARINRYTKGDITYGLNPVIENKIVALYVGSTLVGGDINRTTAEEESYVRLVGHSYINIQKVVLIDLETDKVEIIDRQNTDNTAFLRLISRDFPEGTSVNFKLLDISVDNSLKNEYKVKFNRGSLQKLYAYTANTGGFEDGVFGGFGIRHNVGNQITGSLRGSGLFGYGTTAIASRSLFTTNSIEFVTTLPTELSNYEGDLDLTNMGSELVPLSASTGTLINEQDVYFPFLEAGGDDGDGGGGG